MFSFLEIQGVRFRASSHLRHLSAVAWVLCVCWATLTRTLSVSAALPATVTSPSPGSTFASSSVTFQWTAGRDVLQYFLYVGTQIGYNNLYGQSSALNRSVTVSGLPTNGKLLYVRLWSQIGNLWYYYDYIYRADSPSNSSVQSPRDVINAFSWNYSTRSWEHFPRDGVAWITEDPFMPWIAVQHQVTGTTKPLSTLWQFTSEYTARATRGIDSQAFPGAFQFEGVNYGDFWYPTQRFFGNRFFGGSASFNFTDGLSASIRNFAFKIRGRNPAASKVESQLAALGAPLFAVAIVKHESRMADFVFNQFNPTGSSEGEPRFGPPDGWGMMQIDRTSERTTATTLEVWNWRANLSAGVSILNNKRQAAQNYFDYIKRSYPEKWENPPAAFQVPGTNIALPALDVSTIVLYNSGNVFRDPKTGANYLYCFEFDPLAQPGKRWTFKPNLNNPNYLQRVVGEM